MSRTKLIPLLFLVCCLCEGSAQSQVSDDAIRLTSSPFGVSARSLGMGNAFTSVANDYSSTFWNPAGLAQIENSEVSFNLSHFIFNDNSTYLRTKNSFSNSATNLNTVGMVFPFPTIRGSFVLGIGFSQTKNFTSALKFDGYNTNSSIIQDWAPDGKSYLSYPNLTIAEELQLAFADTNTKTFISRINDSVQQNGTIIEDGGINRWSVSVGMEAAPQLYLGATLNILRGSYSFTRNYTETDINHIYQTNPFDFDHLNIQETIDEDIGGFDMALGMLYNFGTQGSFGIKIQTPTVLSMEDKFRTLRDAHFDNNQVTYYDDPVSSEPALKTSFDISSPMLLSAGISWYAGDFLLSGSTEFSDWQQTTFTDIPDDMQYLNTDIKNRFQSTVSFRGGVEYLIPMTTASLRGGVMYLPSPYKGDPSTFAKKYLTLGAGIVLEDAIVIDLAYAYGYWDSFTNAPNQAYNINEKITTNTIFATITYRY